MHPLSQCLENLLTRLFENSILTAVGVENNEVDSGGGGKMTENLAKSNNSLICMSFLTLSNADI